MKVYKATMEDVKGVAHLFHLYRVFYEQQSNVEEAERYLSERLTKSESVIFVAKEKDTYVGFVQLYPTFSSVSMTRTWILNDLYVLQEARKNGIAQLLLDKVKQFALDTGAKSIHLETGPDNKIAQSLYEKNGYQKDNIYVRYSLPLA
ncbi:GCN5-related N-acetyltransferase [Halalkalibacter wakoensis JCM 9140]|uniref:GCN5-related N-acetyltransferase n=1 Tax=Halalkalibacter wakoensis JCM 9140 TaxID=1236970 RepID=W4Q1M8_9BACI|nr:GNAT family N-acetyltransferase [Halalkalibacter wakoensis]GAE25633.1 GCN5-related N-acetyltransferase [Halalkalibacter wakoensis JCM 9140]